MSLYKRPPITEAVIEVQFGATADQDLLERVKNRLIEHYPAPPLTERFVEVQVGDNSANVNHQFAGFKLTSSDIADVVVVGPRRISTSRLAPYEGWEPFVAVARRNWEVWKKIMGWRQVTRIGVRYINRLDIPSGTNSQITLENYLNAHPRLPVYPGRTAMANFAVNLQSPIADGKLLLTLNVGSTPSPLVKTLSLLLDIDIAQNDNLPQNDEGLWALVDEIRHMKNVIFEASITDQMRAHFQ